MNHGKSIISILVLAVILLSAVLANAVAQPLTDPTGDTLDKTGNPATAEPYLDITEISLAQEGSSYIGTIKVNGNVPSRTSDNSIFIEWDFMIDADKNPSTTPWGSSSLLVNDIGVDFMIRLCLLGDRQTAEAFDATNRRSHGVAPKVSGNGIELTFSPSDIGGSTDFDFTILVREYGNQGASDALIVFDKAPNKGHYSFQASGMVVETTRAVELPSLTMEFAHATLYYNKGNEKRAIDMGQAFDYAYAHLQQDFPESPPKFKLYVYGTRDDLIQGLMTFSGFSSSDAEWFRRTGATPRPVNYVMHVGPNFGWTDVAHELAHSFIQEYSGDAYWQIKWLDEGLAGYEQWKCVLTNRTHSKEAESFRQDSWNAFTEMKTGAGLYSLSELTTDSQWTKLMEAGKSWYIYSEAFVVVAYVSSTYGLGNVIPILKKVEVGIAPPEAVKTVVGTTQEEILNAVEKASQAVIFRVSTATMTLVTTTLTLVSSSTTSPAPATTTQEPLATTSTTSATTQEEYTTLSSTEEGKSAQPPTELLLAGAVIAVMVAVGAIVIRYRKKTSTSP